MVLQIRLRRFAEKVIGVCNGIGVTPIIYGSWAYLFHTKDRKVSVKDVDLLVSKGDLKRIAANSAEFSAAGMSFKYYPKYRTLHISKGPLKAEIDSYEHWSINVAGSKRFRLGGGLSVRMISARNLAAVYGWVSKNSNNIKKRPSYKAKFERLERIARRGR